MEATIDDPVLTSRRNWRDILDRAATEPFGAGTAAQARKMLQDPARQRDPQLAPRLRATRDQMAETLAEIGKTTAEKAFIDERISQCEDRENADRRAHGERVLRQMFATAFSADPGLVRIIAHHRAKLTPIVARLKELNALLAALRKEEDDILQAMLTP